MHTTTQQLQVFNWRGIFKSDIEETLVRKEFEALYIPGKISPFGASFQEDVRALVLARKPIASIDHDIYIAERIACDSIISVYGVEKLEDPINNLVWLFRPEKKEDALRRIAELNNVLMHKPRTFDDFKRIGQLYGYSEVDTNKFILWKKFLIEKKEIQTIGQSWLEI